MLEPVVCQFYFFFDVMGDDNNFDLMLEKWIVCRALLGMVE